MSSVRRLSSMLEASRVYGSPEGFKVRRGKAQRYPGITNIDKQELDRDLNAALNLKKLYTVSSTGIHALGDGSSDCSVTNDFSPSLKKESNGKFTYVLKRSVDFCKF